MDGLRPLPLDLPWDISHLILDPFRRLKQKQIFRLFKKFTKHFSGVWILTVHPLLEQHLQHLEDPQTRQKQSPGDFLLPKHSSAVRISGRSLQRRAWRCYLPDFQRRPCIPEAIPCVETCCCESEYIYISEYIRYKDQYTFNFVLDIVFITRSPSSGRKSSLAIKVKYTSKCNLT